MSRARMPGLLVGVYAALKVGAAVHNLWIGLIVLAAAWAAVVAGWTLLWRHGLGGNVFCGHRRGDG